MTETLQKKNLEQKIYKTLWEKCFRIQFGTSGSAQTRKYALSLSCVFWLGHFPRSKISFESSFLIKCYIITDLNFFLGAFRSVFKKVKKWISHCIFKMWFGRGGYIFSSKIFSEKAKHLRMCPSIGGNVGETWLRQGHIITRGY